MYEHKPICQNYEPRSSRGTRSGGGGGGGIFIIGWKLLEKLRDTLVIRIGKAQPGI